MTRSLLRLLAPLAAALVLLVAVLAGPAAAEEIVSFHSDVTVTPDGTLDVTETIRVTVAGDQVKRGIIRDFPVEYREEDGRTSLVSFDLLGVTRNGNPEPYDVSMNGAYKSIRIGQADVFLPLRSEQTYTIRYLTQGQLRSFDDFDELYWNVTGDGWDFPIRAASVEIHLPQDTPIVRDHAYTGPRGAQGTAYQVTRHSAGLYAARTTAPLGRFEGFTVAVAWPKGVVAVPPVRYGLSGFGGGAAPMTLFGHRAAPLVAQAGAVLGLVLLFLAWLRVGRDPKGGAIYPQFEPPAGLSPAATRYIRHYGFDQRCLTAAIVSLAVKGALRIEETESTGFFGGSTYKLIPTGGKADRKQGISAGEAAVHAKLFPGDVPVTLTSDKVNGQKMDSARAALHSRLKDEHYGATFSRNLLYTVGATMLTAVATALAMFWVERLNPMALIQWAVPAAVGAVMTMAVSASWRFAADLRSGAGVSWRNLAKLLPFGIFAAVFGSQIVAVASIQELRGMLDPTLGLAGAAFGAMVVLFSQLMAAPSKAGRAILDHIEGFEMYMKAAEEDRLDILHPPDETPERFERLLPYAIALGLTHEWSAKFAVVMASATVAPSWYRGTGRFDVNHLDRGVSHAVASTSVPSRSSGSGSGGGGFSGGGGGGGGGRGW